MSKLKLMLTIPVAALALSACVVAPYPRQAAYYPEASGPVIVADVPPPPLYAEVVPAPPFAGGVWIGGYWGWSGGRHQWVGGRWERPRPGYAWAPHRWEQRGGRWHLHQGGWVGR